MIELDFTVHDEPFAIQYEVFRCELSRVVIDRIRQEDGSHKWAIRDDYRQCLSIDGEWHHESMPSWRPEDWIATHRFDDLEIAWATAKVAADVMLLEYKDRVRDMNERRAQREHHDDEDQAVV